MSGVDHDSEKDTDRPTDRPPGREGKGGGGRHMRARASAVVIVSDKVPRCAVSGVDCDSERDSDRPTDRPGGGAQHDA